MGGRFGDEGKTAGGGEHFMRAGGCGKPIVVTRLSDDGVGVAGLVPLLEEILGVEETVGGELRFRIDAERELSPVVGHADGSV